MNIVSTPSPLTLCPSPAPQAFAMHYTACELLTPGMFIASCLQVDAGWKLFVFTAYTSTSQCKWGELVPSV